MNQPWFQASIVRLDGADLTLVDHWEIPPGDQNGDSDFISSPVLWSGTDAHGVFRNMIGACNKNGLYYALDRDHLSAGPVWELRVGVSATDPDACIGTASTDGHLLYVPGNETTINGVTYEGSVRAVNPMTGAIVWEHGFNGNMLAAPTIDGAGVLGVEEFSLADPNTKSMYLLNAATGATLAQETNGFAFGGAVFADGYVLYPSVSKGLTLWAPAAEANPVRTPKH
jgi:outer membrane protein assembly factor BamB